MPSLAPLSVALATYNGETYLREQLESIAAQTQLPAELVVSDDGSTDGTIEVLQAFAADAPFPVHIHRNDRVLGYRDNFLRAASLCSAPWVAFSDQDDVWTANKIAVSMSAAAATPDVVLVTHSASLVGANLQPLGGRMPNYRFDRTVGPLEARPLRVLTGFTLTFRRSLLDEVPLDRRPRDVNAPPHPLAHDQLVPLLANVFGQTAVVAEPLALYRRHGGTVTGEHRTDLRALANSHLASTAGAYLRQARFIDGEAAYLDRLAGCVHGNKSTMAARGATYYRAFAGVLRRRARVYDGSIPTIRRAEQWARLVGEGVYRRVSPGVGLGWRACAKDMALGVVRPTRVAD